MIRIILLLISVTLLILQINKMYQTRKFNKMLDLKQKQLRCYEESLSTIEKTKAPSLKLAFNFSLVFALTIWSFIPTNVSEDSAMPEFSVEKEVVVMETKNDMAVSVASYSSLDYSSRSGVANYSADYSLASPVATDDAYIYALEHDYEQDKSSIGIYETSNATLNKLKTLPVVGYNAYSVKQTEDYLYILGSQNETNYVSEYDTVVQVYSKSDLEEVCYYVLDGYLTGVKEEDNEIIITTEKNIYDELNAINSPYYLSKASSESYDYKEVVQVGDNNLDKVHSVYYLDLEANTIEMDAYLSTNDSSLKIIDSNVYLYVRSENSQEFYKAGENLERILLQGAIFGDNDIHYYQDKLYIINYDLVNERYILTILENDLTFVEEIYFESDIYNIHFSNNILSYSYNLEDNYYTKYLNLDDMSSITEETDSLYYSFTDLDGNSILVKENQEMYKISTITSGEPNYEYRILKEDYQDIYLYNALYNEEDSSLLLNFGINEELANLQILVRFSEGIVNKVDFINNNDYNYYTDFSIDGDTLILINESFVTYVDLTTKELTTSILK